MDCSYYDFAYKNIDKCKFKIQHFIPHKVTPEEPTEELIFNKETQFEEIRYPQQVEAFKKIEYECIPSVCLWTFMSEDEVNEILEISDINKLYLKIETKLHNFPYGVPQKVLIVLILTVIKFCKEQEFDSQQTGATISIFYLTHLYFIGSLYTIPEDIYDIFKKYIFLHSILMPPYSIKIFTVEESRMIILYFCRIYLRNLPLIRFLVLPNYGLKIKYEQAKPPPEPIKKGKKDKKGKKKKK